MICGSCGMRVDGGAVLACKTRIADIVADGHVPVISAMGNLPIVKDLVVDMDPFWQKMRAVQPYLEPRLDRATEKENIVSQERMDVIHKESLCINCGCCVSECNSMESDPDFLGPAALAKGFRFVGDARDGATIERLERYSEEHGIWDCTRCYFCNERCPKGVDPRDAIAKLGAEAMKAGIDRDMGARHAKWFVTSAKTTGWLRETELVPKTQGVVKAIKEIKFAMSLLPKGKVPPPFPPHVAARRGRVARALRPRQGSGPRRRRRASCRARRRSSTSRTRARRSRAARPTRTTTRARSPSPISPTRSRSREAGRLLQGVSREPLRQGARHLHPSARAEGRLRADRARVGDVLRRRGHPRGGARLLPPPERADPRVRRRDGRRHADDGLQRLHAQPAPGELPAPRATRRCASASTTTSSGSARRATRPTSTASTSSGSSRARASAGCRRSPTRASAGSRSRRSTAARSSARRS